MPKISVIVPTRNRPHFLDHALRSVLAQSWDDWECVVVDDGGETPVSIPDDPRFRLLRHETARGPAGARNTGLDAVSGDYVCFLDDDDELTPYALEVLVSEAAPGWMVFGLRGILDSDIPVPQGRWNGELGGAVIDDSPTHAQGLYPRETCQRYDESFRTGEDFEWLLRMGKQHACRTIERLTYRQRLHSGVRLDVGERTHLTGRLQLLAKHKQWFESNPHSYAVQLRRAAAAALNAGEYSLARQLSRRSFHGRPALLAGKIYLKALLLSFKKH